MGRARAASAAIRAVFAGSLVVVLATVLQQPASLALLASGAVAVIVLALGVIRRSPSDHTIAAYIDRDRNLHELLASSLSTGNADGAASMSLRAMASEAAGRLKAEDVRVDMPSGRWAVVSLLIFGAAMITSALIAPPAPQLQQVAGDVAGRASPLHSMTAEAQTSSGENAVAAANESKTQTSRVVDAPPSDDASKIAADSQANAKPSKTSQSDAGSARGATADTSRAQLAFDQAQLSPKTPDEQSSPSTSGREGVGESASSYVHTSTGATAERNALAVSSASIEAHDSARATASAALSAGTVPARCCDLVRAYFDLESPASPSGSK